jgi:hypothetical protein
LVENFMVHLVRLLEERFQKPFRNDGLEGIDNQGNS